MTPETPPPVSRAQRTLAFIVGGLVVLSLLAIFAIIIGTWLGAGGAQGSGKGIWPTVFFIPLIALPAAFVLIIILLSVSMAARTKQNRAATPGIDGPAAKQDPRATRGPAAKQDPRATRGTAAKKKRDTKR